MAKRIIYIMVAGGTIIIFLFIFEIVKQNAKDNGFTRSFKNPDVNISKAMELPLSSRLYFVGSIENNLYFKDLHKIHNLVYVDNQLSKLLQMPTKLPIKTKAAISLTDSVVTITESRSGKVTFINLYTDKISHLKKTDTRLNTTYLLSGNSIIARNTIIKDKRLSRQLIKINRSTGKIEKEFIFKTQVDGFFCTDGTLKYDPLHARLYYIYAYRGEFLCLDTNLKLIYGAKTIDTVTTAQIKLRNVKNKPASTITTQSGPPNIVNRNATIYNNSLLILSALKSDTEDSMKFNGNQVVDVYNTADGSYHQSFYVPKYRGQRLKNCWLKDGFLYGFYNSYLVKYRIGNIV